MKKFACLILGLIMCFTVLCGCDYGYENTFIKHNYERDYAQVMAVIDPINENNTTRGLRDDGSEWSYTSDTKYIYKSQLVNYINNYGESYVSSYGWTYNETVDYFVEQLIMTELILIEADVLFEKHELFWTKQDLEDIQRSVYATLESYLTSICNEILVAAGEEEYIEPVEEEETETTYPVKEEEINTERVFYTYGNPTDENNPNKSHDDWYFNEKWYLEDVNENYYTYPGNFGSEDTKSLYREGYKRLITLLESYSETIVGLSDKEKEQIDNEVAQQRKIVANQGVDAAYVALGKTLLVKKLVGDSLIASQKLTVLQEYIEGNVTVSEEEIQNKYNKMLSQQMSSYTDAAAYDTAATGDDLVLYRGNGNYVYVKHILVQFSEEQTAYLENYKATHNEEEYKAERARLAEQITVYEHVDGEDDLTRPMTVQMLWNEVNRAVSNASASAYDADRAFDKLIYKYNTDPGIFGNELGYAVKYELEADESETYMVEFAEAAREFRREGYSVGQVLDHYIVTDYGIHIMYYSADFKGGEVLTLNDYVSAGKYTLVRDAIEELIINDAISAAYDVWREETIYYYRNTLSVVNIYEDKFKDLYTEE